MIPAKCGVMSHFDERLPHDGSAGPCRAVV
jgi:hypothetical protein